MDIINWDRFLFPYEQAVNELCIKFKAYDKQCRLLGIHSPIEYVEGRVKQKGSILDKANRKNIPYDLIPDKIEDIAGIRIICRFVEDIERVMEFIRRRQGFDLSIVTERDYVNKQKPSGYRSYHVHIRYTVALMGELKEVFAEIQIRTMAMNFWATIEHSLKYKYNGNLPEDLHKRLVSSAEAAFMLDREMGTIREEMLEAQRIVERKNDLVDSILKSIQNLYYIAKLDKMDEINIQFLRLYEEGNIEKLSDFNKQLNVMTQMYRVDKD